MHFMSESPRGLVFGARSLGDFLCEWYSGNRLFILFDRSCATVA